MLTPREIELISEGGEEIAERMYLGIMQEIIKRISIRMEEGKDYILTSSDQWRIKSMMDAGYLADDIAKIISKYTKLEKDEIFEAMQEGCERAYNADSKTYAEAGLEVKSLDQSPQYIRLMEQAYKNTCGTWRNLCNAYLSGVQAEFTNALDLAFMEVMTGSKSWSQAYLDLIKNMGKSNILKSRNSYYDRYEDIEVAAARAIRTGVASASGDIALARMEEMNWDIVLVSSHLGARPDHQVWQGKFYSLSDNGKFPNFYRSTGYGTAEGLCGFNCRHSFGSGNGKDNPFEHYNKKENLEQYEKEQKQRGMERAIRKYKKDYIALRTGYQNAFNSEAKHDLGSAMEHRARVLADRNKAYNNYCKENNLKTRQERLAIAKWDRRISAEARGKARKKV